MGETGAKHERLSAMLSEALAPLGRVPVQVQRTQPRSGGALIIGAGSTRASVTLAVEKQGVREECVLRGEVADAQFDAHAFVLVHRWAVMASVFTGIQCTPPMPPAEPN